MNQDIEREESPKADLAIVIPAFKIEFLEESLESIANQSNKNFTVYIGDDCSPADLYSVCKKYESRFNLKYKRFKENLGGKSLISHWERCIDMSNEKWIWLFSDDDIVDSTAVENFNLLLKQTNESYNVYRFEVATIDDKGTVLKAVQNYPKIESPVDYIKNKMLFRYQSCVTNAIFKRDIFYTYDRFNKFDLAWGSDDALWIKLSFPNGIYTTPNSKVYFRTGSLNISNNKSKVILYRKIDAQYEFIAWIIGYLKDNNLYIKEFNSISQAWFYNITYGYKKLISPIKCFKMALAGKKLWNNSTLSHLFKMVYYSNRLIYKRIKNVINK